jgi:hypothetical protein
MSESASSTDQIHTTDSLGLCTIYRTAEGAFYATDRSGCRSPGNYETDLEAQAWFRRHWTAQPYCLTAGKTRGTNDE